MVRTRARGGAALLVAAALVASAVAPALSTTPAGRSAARAREVPRVVTAASQVTVAALATASPGPVAGPARTPGPGSVLDPSETPSAQPTPGSTTCPATPAGLTAAPIASHGSRDRKVVALTFDDGYNPTTTLAILDVLRRSRVNATFFVTGRAVQLFPGVWREVAAAGFPIADHTYDHHRLAGRCFAAQLNELTRQADAVREALGTDPVALMRPPYGSRDRTTQLAASASGDEAVVLWDVDTQDWSGLGASGIAKRALSGGNGSIILMHTLYATTAAALPRIIAGFRARGFRFVTVGQLLDVAGPVPFG